ncbi:MAG: tetratricopeptide repeat protein [Bacteroidales bacterium]
MRRIIPVIILSALLCLKAFPFRAYDFNGKEGKLLSMPPDTARANLLIDLGKHYCSRNFEKALLFLQEALVLSTELNYSQGIAGSMLWQGRAYYYKDEYEVAYAYLEKAKAIFERIGHHDGLAQYHYAIGAIHNINGNHLNAIQDFQEVVWLSEMSGNKAMMANGYHSLGSLHLQRTEQELAMEYFNKALALNRGIGHLSAEATTLAGIGRVFESWGMYDSALYYLERVLDIKSVLDEERGIASIRHMIGKLLLETGRYREALKMFEASMAIFSSLNDDTGVCINMYKMAGALNALGHSGSALGNAFAALAIARKINNPSLVNDIYATLASLMATNGRFKEAYDYQTRSSHIKDSIAAANREKLIRELELKFQVGQKDSEIKLWKSRNEIQAKNNLLLTIFIISMTAILMLLLFLFRMKSNAMKRRKEIYEQEKTIHRQQSEIRDKEQQLLEKQLESQNRDLASKALEMLKMNETISDIIEKLENFSQKNDVSEEPCNYINGIVAGLEAQLRDNSWNEFEKIFKNIHSDFFQRLLLICPDLTPAEIKVAAFLKLNLNTKEIAAVTYKSEAGIKSTRYRLRKKMGLRSDDSLVPYLMKL